jgi:hypothetical protein
MKANIDALNKAKLRYYQQQIQNAAKLVAKQQQMIKSMQDQAAKDDEKEDMKETEEIEVFDVDKFQPGENICFA